MSVVVSDPREAKRPETAGDARWRCPEGWMQTDVCRLSTYLPFESMVANKRVLDVDGVSVAKDRLRRAKARTVMAAGVAPWDIQAQSVDVVLALGEISRGSEVMLQEVARVLAPGGFAALRFSAAAISSSGQLANTLGALFPSVDLVAQIPIAGFTFDRGGSPGVVVAEDLFPMGAAPSHWVALCSVGPNRPWAGLDSWLVPLARPIEGNAAVSSESERGDFEFRLAELTREREYLRELLMTAQDDRDRLDRLAANLRRDADRGLARLSEQSAALEVLALERDQALKRAVMAETARAAAPSPTNDLEPHKTQPTSA